MKVLLGKSTWKSFTKTDIFDEKELADEFNNFFKNIGANWFGRKYSD